MQYVAFPGWVFVSASVLNLLFSFFPVIYGSVYLFSYLLARAAAKHQKVKTANCDKPVGEAVNEAMKAALKDLSEFHSIGEIIGFVEREIYLYALVSQGTNAGNLIAGVLMFKGFTAWLTLKSPDGSDKLTLARFYSYTIGNFLSLLWAFFFYEFARYGVHEWTAL